MPLLSLPEIRMPGLHRMFRSGLFARPRPPTRVTLDREPLRVGIVMSLLQHPAQLPSTLEGPAVLILHALDPRHLKDLAVELRGPGGSRVAGDDVVVDARVDEDAARGAALVEAVDAQVLHVDAADFDIKVRAQDCELDATAPAVLTLDPAAVVVWLLF